MTRRADTDGLYQLLTADFAFSNEPDAGAVILALDASQLNMVAIAREKAQDSDEDGVRVLEERAVLASPAALAAAWPELWVETENRRRECLDRKYRRTCGRRFVLGP